MIFLNILDCIMLLESTWLLFPFNFGVINQIKTHKIATLFSLPCTDSRNHDLDLTSFPSLRAGN